MSKKSLYSLLMALLLVFGQTKSITYSDLASRKCFGFGKNYYYYVFIRLGLVDPNKKVDSSFLRNMDLSHADLFKVDLKNIDLRDTDLSYANLSRASLQRADLRGAYLSYADLRDADLSHADLRGADFWEVDLRDTDLSHADLRGVNLRYAKVNDNTNFDNACIVKAIGFDKSFKIATGTPLRTFAACKAAGFYVSEKDLAEEEAKQAIPIKS